MADGKVTEDEYEAGYQAYAGCLREAGVPLTEMPRQGRFRQFLVPDQAVSSGVDETCNGRHFWRIDEIYQLAHEPDQVGTQQLRSCAERHGVAVAPDARQVEIIAALAAKGLDAERLCFGDSESSTTTP